MTTLSKVLDSQDARYRSSGRHAVNVTVKTAS